MKVTTNDIAREAGVSQATVSIVLNNNTKVSIAPETRALVLKTAERMGYQFKKRVKGRSQTSVIGLLVPTLSNLYYPFLVQNVEIYAKSLGVTIVTQNTMRNEEEEIRAFDYLRSIGVMGILSLYSPKTTVPEDMFMVIVGEKLQGQDVDTINLNSYAAGRMAVEHLLSLGHRNIAYISTPFTNITDARRKRLEGISSYMEAAGLEKNLYTLVDDENENDLLDSTYEFDCGHRLTEQLMDKYPQCTAIIAVNDMVAIGCMSALNQRGVRIPEDIAICGFDNLYIDRMMQPQLTSVDQMAFHGCKVGLSVLLEKIKKFSSRENAVVLEYSPTLHVRRSTVKEI